MNDIGAVIVGLGNPGADYRGHRHNVGFRVVETLAETWGLNWRVEDRYAVATDEGATAPVVLIKPLTYMNRSGEALAAWAAAAGATLVGSTAPEPNDDGEECEDAAVTIGPVLRPLVVCDDLNLPLGSVRLRARGRSGGQNGLASIIEALGGGDFPRLRLGVASPGSPVDPEEWADFVLTDFQADEREAASEMIAHATEAVAYWCENGLEATASRFNRRVRTASRTEDDETGPAT